VAYFLIPIGIGLLLIFVGVILWRKGDPAESILLALLSWVGDLFTGHFASSIRTLAILLQVTGYFAILVGIMRIIKSLTTNE